MGFLMPVKKTDIPVELKMDEDPFGDEALCLFYGTVKVGYFGEYSCCLQLFDLNEEETAYLKSHDIAVKKTKFVTKVVVN